MKQQMISVIVRSMDRPTLQDALDSIASQTYPNIEVIVVNAKGDSQHPKNRLCGSFPITMVGTGKPLQRSAAANVGLDCSRGDWIAFLDDDDWLAPDHFSLLLNRHQSTQLCNVIYANVSVHDKDG